MNLSNRTLIFGHALITRIIRSHIHIRDRHDRRVVKCCRNIVFMQRFIKRTPVSTITTSSSVENTMNVGGVFPFTRFCVDTESASFASGLGTKQHLTAAGVSNLSASYRSPGRSTSKTPVVNCNAALRSSNLSLRQCASWCTSKPGDLPRRNR